MNCRVTVIAKVPKIIRHIIFECSDQRDIITICLDFSIEVRQIFLCFEILLKKIIDMIYRLRQMLDLTPSMYREIRFYSFCNGVSLIRSLLVYSSIIFQLSNEEKLQKHFHISINPLARRKRYLRRVRNERQRVDVQSMETSYLSHNSVNAYVNSIAKDILRQHKPQNF